MSQTEQAPARQGLAERWFGTATPVRFTRRTRSAAFLLWVVAVFLILRLPLSVVLAGLLPLVVLVWDGIRWPRPQTALLWLFLLTSLVTSTYAWLTNPGVPVVNNATIMAVLIVMTAAITCTSATRDALRFFMNGILFGLWACLLSGIFEVISGVKLLPLIYPDANTAAAVAGNRFIVAGFFPNYNDFSVAMAIFGVLLTAQLLLGARVGPLVKIARIGALLALTFFIVVIGSRGALIGLGLGMVLVALTAARLRRRRLLSVPNMLVLLLCVLAAGMFFMATPFVQDSSTALRGDIIGNTIQMLLDDPHRLWAGWSNMVLFREDAALLYEEMLMDPHNLLLELVTMYGLPAMITYVLVWAYVLYRGVWQLRITAGWREVSAVCITVLMPVLGIVPSSTLRYYWVHMFLAAAFAALQMQAKRRRTIIARAGAPSTP
ncbi:O-antigen ligase family protein [Propionibacteriaceae bacterium G1746]|uniref:O-antigen ligase family protein n=1 Tax=Aestuariimicrobium sp. G57 TaxID=3418485 RepID=UPI003C1ACD43